MDHFWKQTVLDSLRKLDQVSIQPSILQNYLYTIILNLLDSRFQWCDIIEVIYLMQYYIWGAELFQTLLKLKYG